MELKQKQVYLLNPPIFSLNRTFMELKQQYSRAKPACLLCLNRTFMELKHFNLIENGRYNKS